MMHLQSILKKEYTREERRTEVVLTETSSDMSLDAIEGAALENLKTIENRCNALRGEIETKWTRIEEIRTEFNNQLLQIQEVEAMIEHQLDALAGEKENRNAMLPAAIESNIKALHVKTKRAKHSVNIMNKILDEGQSAIDLPMVATFPDDRLGLEADTLLAEIDALSRELERIEASCAL